MLPDISYEDELRVIAREAALTEPGAIEDIVYANFYCRPRQQAPQESTREERLRFFSDLTLANRGTGHWEPGWYMAARDGGLIVVLKRGVRFFASPSEVRESAEFLPASCCRVRIPKEMRALIPGFYCAVGDADGSDDPQAPLVRLYWNLNRDGAARYIELTTTKFNSAEIPFWTKVLSDPGGYVRADAGVLYVERTRVNAIAPIVHQIYDQIAPFLHDDVPMFTRRLARGLAWAEDPGGARSFGQTRCHAIARGLQACVDGSQHPEDRYRVLYEALKEDGIDPKAPYLCGGSDDAYACLATP